MADLEFYRLSMTGAEADSGIRTGMEAGATSGVLFGDGTGGVTAATPGRDFGFPLLTGNGPPTGNTAANIGQHYFDMQATAAPYEYICVGLNSNGFIWIVFGDTGDGFKISGYFVSLEALETAISAGTVAAPTEGTAYGIGEAAPYDIYVWDAVNSEWVNNGPLGASSGGSGVPPHGTTGQVLTKLSDLDGDAGWKDVVARAKVEADAPAEPDAGDFWFDTDENNEFTVDNAPTSGSNNLVTSGGVYSALQTATNNLGAEINTKISMIKLWENASPTSEFAEQTIALDLSGYDCVAVETQNGGGIHWSNKSGTPTYISNNFVFQNALYTACRAAEASDAGVIFRSGYLISGTTVRQEDVRLIPIAIYGIKGVQE